ncbi:MAG: tRNA pseudouridine(38-40) synthase TruA [Spirochaetaceae bacterium]|jgi:tRNA pseudouridine38-40 synthase|nr:tRNA pseudouridine(38-40) synthase TruA [Spirochaetaceae bacterium]
MNERNIRLLIAYDGTDFAGWQTQKDRRTVQSLIEAALETIHGEKRVLYASGRTDAGVHAAGQTANFYTTIANMEGRRFVPSLNSLLPGDVRVLQAAETSPGFHARFDARRRTYRYHIIAGRAALPHERRYALQVWRRPDINRLNEYARLLRGEMDCSIFASSRDPSKSRTRYIYGASFFVQGDVLVFEISANAFLRRMVRSVTGTLLHYEQRGIAACSLRDILRSADRSLAGPTVPPEGLFLWKVDYYREGL